MERRARRALRPVLVYVVSAAAWIVASDLVMLRAFSSQHAALGFASVAKGLGFVLVTGALLFRAISVEMRLLARSEAEARSLNRGLRTLAAVQRLAAEERDEGQFLQTACQLVVDGHHLKAAWAAALDEATGEWRLRACWPPLGVGEGRFRAVSQAPATLTALPPARQALQEGRPVASALEELAPEDPQRELAQAGVKRAGAFPLKRQGRTIGAFVIYAADAAAFDGAYGRVLEEVADAVSLGLHVIALDRARLHSDHLFRVQMARLAALRDRDALTQLYNRQRFEEFMAEELEESRRSGRPFAIVVFDLDRFAEVNARFGHESGDRVLAAVGRRLREAVQVAERIGRIGGDSFAVLLPGADACAARDVAKQMIREVTATPVVLDGETIPVSATGGIVAYPEHGRTQAELESAMDSVLVQARQQRTKVAVFDRASHSRWLQFHSRGELVRRALEERLIVPAFQPVVDLHSGRFYGYEVLARIKDRERLVEAAEFIREAEAYELMEEVDRQILEGVVALCHDARLAGRRLFINLASDLLSRRSYREAILRVLDQHPEFARSSVWEVTERHSLPDMAPVLAFIEEVKGRGAQIALDDFGSGYSSIGYFRRLSVDYVKIDGALVREAGASALDERVVAAIRRVAVELGAETVAESVEDAATAQVMRQMGVRFGQGYYLGRPALLEHLAVPPAPS